MKANDFQQFSIALERLATPLNVEQRKKIKSATKSIRGPHTDSFEKPTDADLEKTFPLPREHEINQPFDEATHSEDGINIFIIMHLIYIYIYITSLY